MWDGWTEAGLSPKSVKLPGLRLTTKNYKKKKATNEKDNGAAQREKFQVTQWNVLKLRALNPPKWLKVKPRSGLSPTAIMQSAQDLLMPLNRSQNDAESSTDRALNGLGPKEGL